MKRREMFSSILQVRRLALQLFKCLVDFPTQLFDGRLQCLDALLAAYGVVA
eukprot:CAMPEP_0174724112 /NCGR_PEP_ID=MMETSP1094-20130205/42630_1 /TAXON_ID=156173 /ORGANISM="Chrysochromulina brevifilum, Strain UTEX LB 985" /LENGTH=50 /DNA_ID=CAMNT_0015925279 /DNA_START=93 /DNA_END=242 /DNA_ORIENTATION=-